MTKTPSLPPDAGPVARAVYQRMMSSNLGQKALAHLAGVNETYIRDILKGKSKNPKSDQLLKVATALGCDLEDLTGPRRSSSNNHGGKLPYSESEIALIEMWRILSPSGKNIVISKIIEMLPRATKGRQANDV